MIPELIGSSGTEVKVYLTGAIVDTDVSTTLSPAFTGIVCDHKGRTLQWIGTVTSSGYVILYRDMLGNPVEYSTCTETYNLALEVMRNIPN